LIILAVAQTWSVYCVYTCARASRCASASVAMARWRCTGKRTSFL